MSSLLEYRAVEIHALGADGVTRRINAFRGENDAIRASGPDARMAKRADLLRAAMPAAITWQTIFPRDKVFVAEVKDSRTFSPESRRAARVVEQAAE